MNYKVLLLSLLSLASYNIYSMEAIIEPEEVQEVSRFERRLNEIVYELKVATAGLPHVKWDILDRMVKRLLKNISLHMSLEGNLEDNYMQVLNNISDTLKLSKEPLMQAQIFIGFISSGLGALAETLTVKYLPNMDHIYKLGETLKKVIGPMMIKLTQDNIDLFDNWFLYIRENKFNQFENDYLKHKELDDLGQIIEEHIRYARFHELIQILKEKHIDIINFNLANKKFGINQLYLLNVLILLSFSDSNIFNVKDLILKYINLPQISANTLDEIKLKLIKQIDEANKNLHLKDLISEKLDILINYVNAIEYRVKKIKDLQEKLFEAIDAENVDINLIRRRTYELYSITRDFQNANGDTPLHLAVLTKNKELIATFLGIYPELIDIKNNNGQTPISLAAGDTEMLSLIFKIADICEGNIKNDDDSDTVVLADSQSYSVDTDETD